MQKADTLIHTKLRLPFTRPELVPRPRLQEQAAQGLCGPLTLIVAPAGFGKTTLVASCITSWGMPVAWLSLDKDDNHEGRFLSYVVAALQEAEPAIGSEAKKLVMAAQQASPEAVLTCLINDLDASDREIALVLDDYQFISSQAVHSAVVFLLEHCPNTLHVVLASRSDPPLPLARLRARGQTVELRTTDLRFTEPEAAQFLNEVMGLRLDSGSVAALEERTEGWIAGLQMASIAMQSYLSRQDQKDVIGFIEEFSGTNRYILDYLLEEVLASQPPEIQHFLLYTSILERLSAPLCNSMLGVEGGGGKPFTDWMDRRFGERGADLRTDSPAPLSPAPLNDSQAILEYLERSNLFLVPLDDERQWYRYHHLFADLLRARLDQLYPGLAPQLHKSAAEWYEQNGLILDAIQHASLASDTERVERLIEQNYIEMMNRGEMSWVRYWMGKLSKDLVTRRPWLCLYEALSRSWYGQLEEANLLLDEAEKRIRSEASAPSAPSMLGYHAFVKSRVTAMQGDTLRAVELCRSARETIPEDNLGLQIDVSITLGYEYFLYGDFENASQVLNEMIQSGYHARAINNPVAGYAILARIQVYQGRLHAAKDLLQKAEQLIRDANGQFPGVTGLVEVGTAALLFEWNEVEAALVRLKQGLVLLPSWGKADDLCLAYTTLMRIHLALGNRTEAADALEKAAQIIQACGVFSEARGAVEAARVKMWLVQDDRPEIDRWSAALEKRSGLHDPIRYEDEPVYMNWARVLTARNNPDDAIRLLSCLEESARSAGRMGRVLEILILEALAMQATGDSEHALLALTECLALAEPEGYVRVFLDEGKPMQGLLAQWLAHACAGPLRDYTVHLLSQFKAEPQAMMAAQERVPLSSDLPAAAGQALGELKFRSAENMLAETEFRSAENMLIETLSQRELEVLHLISQGMTNQEIARQLVVAPGTVKAHTSSIYRKLDVTNRTEAAARARQLGILP